MGIGVWYEMYVSDPIAYLYKNADPARLAARQRLERHRALASAT